MVTKISETKFFWTQSILDETYKIFIKLQPDLKLNLMNLDWSEKELTLFSKVET